MLVNCIFVVLLLVVVLRLIRLAVRACWGLLKIVLGIVFLPLILIGLAVGGLMLLAIVITVLVGIVAFIL